MFTIKRVFAGLFLSACGVAAAQGPAQVSLDRNNNALAQPAGRAAQEALRDISVELAAQDGTLPAGFPFEVKDVGDLKRARIGFGYEEFQADPQALLGGLSLGGSARSSGTWRYTVTVDGQPVGLLSMAWVGGKWEAVSMGAAKLALEVNALAAQHATKGLRFIRVLQASSDFIEVTDSNRQVHFAPLAAARASLGMRAAGPVANDGLVDEAEFSQALRDAVSRGIAN